MRNAEKTAPFAKRERLSFILCFFYKIRTSGESNIPAKGGVLLLPNHVTCADAFFLTAACPRRLTRGCADYGTREPVGSACSSSCLPAPGALPPLHPAKRPIAQGKTSPTLIAGGYPHPRFASLSSPSPWHGEGVGG